MPSVLPGANASSAALNVIIEHAQRSQLEAIGVLRMDRIPTRIVLGSAPDRIPLREDSPPRRDCYYA